MFSMGRKQTTSRISSEKGFREFLTLIGIGEGGCRLLDQSIAEMNREFPLLRRAVGDRYIAADSSPTTLSSLKNIPAENMVPFGEEGAQRKPGIGKRLFEELGGAVQVNTKLKALRADRTSIFVVFFALAGGTGCGSTPSLIRDLRQNFPHATIFVFGVLPFYQQEKRQKLNVVWVLGELLKILEEDKSRKDPTQRFRIAIFPISNQHIQGHLGKAFENQFKIPARAQITSHARIVREKALEFELKILTITNSVAIKIVAMILSLVVRAQFEKRIGDIVVSKNIDPSEYMSLNIPICNFVVPCIHEDVPPLEKIEQAIDETLVGFTPIDVTVQQLEEMSSNEVDKIVQEKIVSAKLLGSTCSFPMTERELVRPNAHMVITLALGNHYYIAGQEARRRISQHIVKYMAAIRTDPIQEFILDPHLNENKLLILLGAPEIEDVKYWYRSATKELQRINSFPDPESYVTNLTELSAEEVSSNLKILGDSLSIGDSV